MSPQDASIPKVKGGTVTEEQIVLASWMGGVINEEGEDSECWIAPSQMRIS